MVWWMSMFSCFMPYPSIILLHSSAQTSSSSSSLSQSSSASSSSSLSSSSSSSSSSSASPQMNSPHGQSRIMSLSFAKEKDDPTSTLLSSLPSSYNRHVMCATCSDDGTVKVWIASKASSSSSSSSSITIAAATAVPPISSTSLGHTIIDSLHWTCSYSFQYRDVPARSLVFSRDGSVLSVSHGNLLTLWDPNR